MKHNIATGRQIRIHAQNTGIRKYETDRLSTISDQSNRGSACCSIKRNTVLHHSRDVGKSDCFTNFVANDSIAIKICETADKQVITGIRTQFILPGTAN